MKILPIGYPKTFSDHKINDLCVEIERVKKDIQELKTALNRSYT